MLEAEIEEVEIFDSGDNRGGERSGGKGGFWRHAGDLCLIGHDADRLYLAREF